MSDTCKHEWEYFGVRWGFGQPAMRKCVKCKKLETATPNKPRQYQHQG